VVFIFSFLPKIIYDIFVCSTPMTSLVHPVYFHHIDVIMLRYVHKLWNTSLYNFLPSPKSSKHGTKSAVPWNVFSGYKSKVS